MISVYSHRWVIEEFFRNAKQLTDMEGATIRSEQGVTLSLCNEKTLPEREKKHKERIILEESTEEQLALAA